MESDEPLGARSNVIDIESLTRWNLTQLPEIVESGSSDGETEITSPFHWRADLNSKIIFW